MSHEFNLNFDEMHEPEAVPAKAVQDTSQMNYREAGHGRNLCFLWPDDNKLFLNYSYLIACEHFPADSSIKLEFTLHTILLKGVQLEPLFYQLMDQQARVISCTDERYNSIQHSGYVINEIIATKKE